MSLPFVHTARRYYRLSGLVRLLEQVLVLATGLVLVKAVKLGHLEEVQVVTRYP